MNTPENAVKVWLDVGANSLCMELPQSTPSDRPHTIGLSLDKCSLERSEFGQVLARQKGWEVLLHILKARAIEAGGPTPEMLNRIGRVSAMTQDQADAILRGMEKARNQGYTPSGLPKEVDVEALGQLI